MAVFFLLVLSLSLSLFCPWLMAEIAFRVCRYACPCLSLTLYSVSPLRSCLNDEILNFVKNSYLQDLCACGVGVGACGVGVGA